MLRDGFQFVLKVNSRSTIISLPAAEEYIIRLDRLSMVNTICNSIQRQTGIVLYYNYEMRQFKLATDFQNLNVSVNSICRYLVHRVKCFEREHVLDVHVFFTTRILYSNLTFMEKRFLINKLNAALKQTTVYNRARNKDYLL